MNTEGFNVARFLSMLALFTDLSPSELTRMAQGCQTRHLARGDMIFRYGEPCEEFHVVVYGQVKLFALSPSGHEKVIELIGPGQSFAEALMFTDKPYILNAQALTNTFLVSVGKQIMLSEIGKDPRFSLRLLAGICRRLHGFVRDIESQSLHSGMQRVIGYLLREHQAEDCVSGEVLTVCLPVSKATVASRLSLTPEYFSKVLHELESKRLIEIDKRDIRIIDAHGLVNYGLQ